MGSQLTYEKVVSKINDKIDLIRRFGKDTTEYESALEQIINGEINLPPYLDHSNSKGSAVLKKDLQFEEKMKSLNELLEKLESNENAIKLHIKNETLKNAITNFKIGDSLSEIVKQAKSLIELLKNIEFQGDSEKNYSSDIYKTIYEIIKLELISVGSSSLLNYIIKNDKGIEFINDCVREDLSHLDLNSSDNKDIKSKILELSSIGIDYNFANESLILMIMLKTDERIRDSILYKIEKLNEYKEEKEKEIEKSNEIIDSCKELNEDYSYKRKKARIKAIITAGFILLNGLAYKISNNIVKNANTDIQYMTTREVYDTYTGQTKSQRQLEYKSGENSVYIKDYGKVSKNGNRNLKTYKITNNELESVEYYGDAELGNCVTNNYYSYTSIDQLTKEEYRIIEKVTYAEEPTIDFNSENYQKSMKYIFLSLSGLSSLQAMSFLRYLVIAITNSKKYRKNNKIIKSNENMITHYENWVEYKESQIKELEDMTKDDKNLSKDKYLKKVHDK